MKKYLFAIIISLLVAANTYSQEVYNEIRNNAVAAANSPQSNNVVKQINTFKVDALDYLILKMREQMPDSTTIFLDKQAFALNNFINYYIQTIVESQDLPANSQLKIIELFMDASISNPLFNDSDKELVHGYFVNGNCLTRFSLDTDWRRAAAAVYNQLEKK